MACLSSIVDDLDIPVKFKVTFMELFSSDVVVVALSSADCVLCWCLQGLQVDAVTS